MLWRESDARFRFSRHQQYVSCDVSPPDCSGQTVIVREDDNLAFLCKLAENDCELIDANRVHGLNGVIDQHEAEWCLPGGHSGNEETQSESHQLALRHDAERLTSITVYRHGHLNL